MDDNKVTNSSSCCKANVCGIAGIILLVLATILTLVTLSGLGILGMFFVGLMLACHKNRGSCHCFWGCKCCCTSNYDTSCHVKNPDELVHDKLHDKL